jgi:translation initiation factor 2A
VYDAASENKLLDIGQGEGPVQAAAFSPKCGAFARSRPAARSAVQQLPPPALHAPHAHRAVRAQRAAACARALRRGSAQRRLGSTHSRIVTLTPSSVPPARGSYLQVFHKPGGAEGEKNLKARRSRAGAAGRAPLPLAPARGSDAAACAVAPRSPQMYELPSGRVAYATAVKTYNRDRWPVMQWADDESVCMRSVRAAMPRGSCSSLPSCTDARPLICSAAAAQVNNEVQLLSPADFGSGAARRLRVPGVNSASLSPGPTPVVAAFVPEAKGAPGSVRIFPLPSCAPGEAVEAAPLARRSFFRVSHVRFKWNPPGTALLLLATADVDATNQSYYGESSLHFLRVDASVEGAVPLPKDGPVHDVAWSPRGTEFAAVYGFMPARATLYSDKLTVVSEINNGPFNMAKWNPFGRFLALAGFGNLPGDVALLDRKADGKCKPMAEARLANSVALEWSPCGRYALTCTTAPRLQVDNGFRVARYTGENVFAHASAPGQLFAICWAPAPAGAFPDRPQTPGAAAAAKAAAPPAAAARAPAYRPPGAAARAPSSGGPQFSLAREAEPFFKPGAARSAPSGPPGAEFIEPSKTAAKNAKKRAAAKAKAAADGVAGLSVSK